MQNVVIFTKKTVLLQAIQDAVGHGYTHFTSGSTPTPKLAQAIAVFDGNYRAFADKNERARRGRMDLGNIHAFFHYREGDDFVSWWLLAKPPEYGKHPIHQSEKLQDALDRKHRIVISGLELIRLPKVGTSDTKLTWQMTDEQYQSIAEEIRDAVRSRSFWKMEQVLVKSRSIPQGFNGARVQYGHLMVLYRREVKRASVKGAPVPPTILSYTRRIRHDGVSVRQVLAMTSIG